MANVEQWRKLEALEATCNLDNWLTEVGDAPSWALLQACRSQIVHKTIPRRLHRTVSQHRQPVAEIQVGGETHSIDAIVDRFVGFGEKSFADFCGAVLAEYR